MTIDITVTRSLPLEPQIFLAAQALLNGELVVFPTETVYGIGADAMHDDAISRLISIKQRPADKPFPVMFSSYEKAIQFVDILNAEALARDFWPGPLTLVLPSKACLSEFCCPGGTIAVRCPNHPVAQAILAIADIPLAVPSANVSHQPPATTSWEARRAFDGFDEGIAFRILDPEPTQGQPTTIVKIEPNQWTILRKGPVSAETIRHYLPAGVSLMGE